MIFFIIIFYDLFVIFLFFIVVILSFVGLEVDLVLKGRRFLLRERCENELDVKIVIFYFFLLLN